MKEYNVTFYYRIKQEPTYRPFKTQEECWNEMQKHQPFGWVKNSDFIYCFCSSVSGFGKEGGFVTINGIAESFDIAYGLNTFADGAPFGIKVKE